ncbi:hypothetical protein [Parasphingorhabdus sp.]|uniref:hypothetical protein n=1 Tax=Parasphingorhabdus sp. TaxID=2709688 RepID=UPI002B27B043|nr:hypothetical protein [Parasphingorhabdus sp.]
MPALPCQMDSLLLFLLLLGGTPDRPSIDAPGGPSRVQAMASARILRGEAIDFEAPVDWRDGQVAEQGKARFQIATIRSAAVVNGADGQTIQLQEFH